MILYINCWAKFTQQHIERRKTMKFMVQWKFHEGKQHDTLAIFSKMTPEQDQALMGDQIRLIGRWHDLVAGRGVAIFESDSVEAISAYALNWNQYMDLEIAVVTDDDEARRLGQNLSQNS